MIAQKRLWDMHGYPEQDAQAGQRVLVRRDAVQL